MYQSFTKWLHTSRSNYIHSLFSAKKYAQYVVFCTCISLTPYITPWASEEKGCSEDFFVESIEVVASNGSQVSVEESETIQRIASLPEKTNVKLPNDQLLQSASHRLFQQGYVVSIKSQPLEHAHAAKLQITLLQKLAKIASLTWRGIKPSEEKELLRKLALEEGKFLHAYHKKEAQTIIKSYFKQKGYPQIQVELKETSPADYLINLCFEVKKGDKTYVNKVVYRGNDHLSSKELAEQMPYTQARIKKFTHLLKKLFTWSIGIKGFGYIKRFFIGTPLVEHRLEEDINWLKDYYYTKGFIEVAITHEVTYKKKGYADILLKITEGPQYRIRQISWHGNKVCTDNELNRFLGIKPGAIVDLVYLKKKIYGVKGLKRYYDAKGYYLASFDLKMSKNKAAEVNLALQLKEQPQLVINKIVIQKDQPINFTIRKVLQQNGLQEGKHITDTKLENARNSLIHTGLFIPEKIQFTIEQQEGNRARVVCNLGVKPPNMIFRGGFDGFDGVLYINMTNVDIKKILQGKRPCVGSQKLLLYFSQNTADLIWNRDLSELFTAPKRKTELCFQQSINSFYTPITLGLDMLTTSSKEATQAEYKKSATFSLSTKRGSQTEFSQWRTAFGFHTINVENLQLDPNQPLNLYQGNIKQLLWATDYTRHGGNDGFYPTKGSELNISLKKSFNLWNHPLLDANYGQLIGAYSIYMTTPRISGLQRPLAVKWKWAAGLTSLHQASPMGRFFLGTPNSQHSASSLDSYYVALRGYNSKNMPIMDAPGQTYSGGACFFMQKIELRYALEESIPSYGLIFVDFACASQSLTNPFSTYGIASGIGFRTKTPLGVLGIDLAWPLVGQKRWLPKFHVQFGLKL